MRVLLALLLFLAVLYGASQIRFPSAGSALTDRGAVDALLHDYVQANQAKDADALAALYDDDALLLPPDEPPVQGRAEILAFWKDGVEPGLEVAPLRVEIHGDAAVIVGRYTVPERDDAPADSGKCVLLLHRRGRGRWRVTTDIWNTSAPRADAEAEEGDSVPATVTAFPAGYAFRTMAQSPTYSSTVDVQPTTLQRRKIRRTAASSAASTRSMRN